MTDPAGPAVVVWDATYACPLRCVHCYSAAGRRPARQLGPADRRRLVDAMLALRPGLIAFAGGEPLLVPDIAELAGRVTAAGVPVEVYTGGWTVTAELARRTVRSFSSVVVSLDGADAAVHDRIRGRAGSFDRALAALALLDAEVGRLLAAGRPAPELRIDVTVIRGNFAHLERCCTEVAGRFPHLGTLFFGAAVPSGLASRAGFAEHELVTEEQAAQLAGPGLAARLEALVPPGVQVVTTDNRALQLHPEGERLPHLQVEPDGAVRAMSMYEGVVGNLLTEPGTELWRRAVARWQDPVVTGALGPARTMRQWAAATRRIDEHFGSAEVRALIAGRPAYRPA